MSTTGAGLMWQAEVQPLLDNYLRTVGVDAAYVRSRWIETVLLELQMHIEDFAADDITERAVEQLRDAIDLRLARVADLDPRYERRQIAEILAVLLQAKYADIVNTLFTDLSDTSDPQTRVQLRAAMAVDCPRPVPPEARLEMPVQAIESRRPINPLRRLREGAG